MKHPTLYIRTTRSACLTCWDAGCRVCQEDYEYCRVRPCPHGEIFPHDQHTFCVDYRGQDPELKGKMGWWNDFDRDEYAELKFTPCRHDPCPGSSTLIGLVPDE